MSKKQQVHAFVDFDNYLWLKANVDNMSKYFNDVVTISRETNPNTPKEEAILISDKERLELTLSKGQEELHRINIELLSLRDKRAKNANKKLDEALSVEAGLRNARVLNYD